MAGTPALIPRERTQRLIHMVDSYMDLLREHKLLHPECRVEHTPHPWNC